MDTPFSFSGSGIVSHFLTFSPCLIALIYLFSAARKRKSIAGTNQNNNEVVDKSSCCASCGIVRDDDVKLMQCDGCDLVRYCSDDCQRDHKSEHEEACKKRAVELRLRDELLFMQPESTHLGDCPLCCLPLPLDVTKSTLMKCCSKLICNGCFHANIERETRMRLRHVCPFCREALPKTHEESFKQNMERMEANDPFALRTYGAAKYTEGNYGFAFEYFTKAAELGFVEAHSRLAELYQDGKGVEKDIGKEVYHLEKAAIGGHPHARHNLGAHEWKNGNKERAVKHWIIAATQGEDTSIKALMNAFKKGYVEKDELAAALRSHQAAVDAAKSPQRERTEVLLSKRRSVKRGGFHFSGH